jgi:1,4-dihydroxy-2-naphthoyl-CoA hydrolase
VQMTPEQLAAYRSGFDDLLGIQLVEASGDRVVARVPVTPQLLQPGGIVHGGVYCALIEGSASVGAFLWLDGAGMPVGVSNSTDFIAALSEGEITAVATPLQRGRLLQLWEVDVQDGGGRRVAHGKVKLVNRKAQPG